MILTQYLIDMFKQDNTLIDSIINDIGFNNILAFLYPHPIKTKKKLTDFFFNRHDFLFFIQMLKTSYPEIFENFVQSCKHSAVFKYTGFKPRKNFDNLNIKVQPILSDNKEILNVECGHSILYQCYSDTTKCMLCDLKLIAPEFFI